MTELLSDAVAAAVLAQDTDEIPIARVRFSLPDGQQLRYVNNTEPLVGTEGTYEVAPFEVAFPNDNEDGDNSVSMRLDSIDQDTSRKIRAQEGIPTVSLDVVMASEPTSPILGPFELQLQQASVEEISISLDLGAEEDFLNQSIPAQSVNPSNSPGYWGAA